MRSAYKFLAYAIDALILLQAAAMAWAVFGLSTGSRTATRRPRPASRADELPVHRGARVHDPRHQRHDADPAGRPDPADHLLLRQGAGRCQVRRRWCSAASCSRSPSASSATRLPALGFIHGFWALLLFWLACRTAKQATSWSRPPRPLRLPRPVISRDRVRVLVGVVLTLALVVPLGWMWWGSRLPVAVLRDGHGLRGLRRRPALRSHDMAGMDTWPGWSTRRARSACRRPGHPEDRTPPTSSST